MKLNSIYLTSENDVLIIRKDLATAIGLNEAIILNQIHYWIQKNKDDEHFKDGRYWMYETYEGWHDQIPFMSISTIKRAIKTLKDKQLVETQNFNKKNWDRTVWYSVNYEKIDETVDKMRECQIDPISDVIMTQSVVSDCTCRKGQVDTTNTIDYTETTSKTTSENTISIEHFMQNAPLIYDLDGYMNHVEKALDTDANDDICKAIRWFFEKYEDFTGHPHIMLKLSTVKDIADELVPYSDHLKEMMIWYYKKKASRNCCGLSHFASGKMLAIIACETVGPGPVQNRWCLVN